MGSYIDEDGFKHDTGRGGSMASLAMEPEAYSALQDQEAAKRARSQQQAVSRVFGGHPTMHEQAADDATFGGVVANEGGFNSGRAIENYGQPGARDEHGYVPAGQQGGGGRGGAGGGGDAGEIPQLAGGKVNINDIGRFVPGFHDLPQWKRDQIIQGVQAQNAQIEDAEAKQRNAEAVARGGGQVAPPPRAAGGAPAPRAIEAYHGGWS